MVDERTFIEATDFMIDNYFCMDNYYKINGGCYVSFYMLAGLISGLGGVKETTRVLKEFRERAKSKGHDLHLNAIIWGEQILSGEEKACSLEETNDLIDELGFDSIASYVWVHHFFPDVFPTTDYRPYKDICEKLYKKMDSEYRKDYFPNVTMGWDSSPRTIQSDVYDNVGYIKSRKAVVFSTDTTKREKRGSQRRKGEAPKNYCVHGIEKPRGNPLG